MRNVKRTFVSGDWHGGYKALKQCLERCNFDYENDGLIQLGDICDGWSEVYECVEEALKIRYFVGIRGNHDDWFITWLKCAVNQNRWKNGGIATLKSYVKHTLGDNGKIDISQTSEGGFITNLNVDDIPYKHKMFFYRQAKYYIDEEQNLFIHGGFNRHLPLKEQPDYVCWWDRDLWAVALSHESTRRKQRFKMADKFKEIYIGHTATTSWDYDYRNIGTLVGVIDNPITTPMHAANIWNVDTGAGGSNGKITFMDINTKEIYQSDLMKDLYPDEKGRW